MKWVLVAGSTLGHVAALFGLGELQPERPQEPPTVISMVEIPPEELPVEEPLPLPEPPKVAAPTAPTVTDAPPLAAPAAPSSAPPAAPQLAGLPDLGLSLSGGSGAGGLSVASGGGGGSGSAPARRALNAPAPAPAMKDKCQDGEVKPKVLSLPKPGYTEAARSAGISGKVRVSITVGANGVVESAQVVQSLGHGLDDAALAAARSAQFEPAVRCGAAVSSTFTLSIKFSAN